MSDLLELFKNWDDILEYPAGKQILSEETAVTNLFVVLSGEVELSLRGKLLGKESTGGIIGEMAILSSVAGNPTVRALTAVRLARLSREQFTRLISDNPAFSQQALLSMAKRLRAANAFISTQLEDRD
ncbi:MAG TPA: cyclic nucleotide-binding domain-containing protein [Xanthomonadales bacterium]|nr:cyclic nucleotide-binding domain-containing protein [Xanthomonadales bacterium]